MMAAQVQYEGDAGFIDVQGADGVELRSAVLRLHRHELHVLASGPEPQRWSVVRLSQPVLGLAGIVVP